MPPRKSNVSTTLNGVEESGAEPHSVKASKDKDGLSIDDLSLPKSMIARLAKGVLPANTQIQKDALLALHKSATVFVSYLASNSGENAQAAGKRTIQPLDVMAALKDSEFDEFLPRLEAELKKYNDTQCDKRNTYRRKIKEVKATTTDKEDGEGTEISTSNLKGENSKNVTAITNGHTNGHSEPEGRERPSKKLKAVTGAAVSPRDEMIEDDEDVNGEDEDEDEGESEDDEDDEDDEVEEEEDEEVEEGEDEGEEEASQDESAPHPYSHDETLDGDESD